MGGSPTQPSVSTRSRKDGGRCVQCPCTTRELHPRLAITCTCVAALVFLFVRTIPWNALTRCLKSGRHSQPWAQGRFNAGAAVIRRRIYVVGGFVGSGPKNTSSAERFDGAWTTVPPMTPDVSSPQPSSPRSSTYLVVMTATHVVPLDTLELLDPAIEKWELIRPTLHRRRHTTVAVLRTRRGRRRHRLGFSRVL